MASKEVPLEIADPQRAEEFRKIIETRIAQRKHRRPPADPRDLQAVTDALESDENADRKEIEERYARSQNPGAR